MGRILESFIACAEDFPEWTLRYNGSGSEEEVLALKEKLAQIDPEIAHRVEIGGTLNAKEVLETFAQSSLAVMASEFEGLPMSFLEAMQVGTPLISYLLPAHFERWCLKWGCLLYTSPSPRDVEESRMPSSA